jgi:hypothetical protein
LLRYFRINDPYRLVGLLVLLLIIYLPLFIDAPPVTDAELKAMVVGEKLNDGSHMYTQVADNTAPLAAWFHMLEDMLFSRSILARHIFAFILILFQSAYLGIIFITKKAFNENTFIPSLIFSVLYFFSFDTIALSDELLGSTFLLFALNNLFKEIEFRAPRDETVFNLGIYVSLASLFYFPYTIFLFGILVSLFLFARATLRKFMLFVFAFLLPHLFVLSVSYLNESISQVWSYYYMSNLAFGGYFIVSLKGLFILGAVPVFYLIVSMVMLNRLARFSKYQSQMLQSIFLWIGFCFVYFLFCKEVRPQTFIVLIPPLTFLLTHFLLLIRRRKYAEMNTWIMLIGVVLIAYLSRYNKLRGVDYSALIVQRSSQQPALENKSVLVLGDDNYYFLNNKAATPFVNWNIASDVFTHPEYYETVTKVYDALKNDPPTVIVDQNNLMKPFFARMPEIKKQYQKEGIFYTRK